MTRAREQQICCEDTHYYHCISRVVRRAFLCGFDHSTKQDFEHRRQWVVDRLAEIDSVFCVDICAYTIMSNHYHLVLYINKQAVENLTDLEVIERWRKLYKGPEVIERYLRGEPLSASRHLLINEIVEKWRCRLSDISWFMRCLNEFIARKANSEDKCTGRFWEGRFKSQALLDEHALLTCMAYVELNPIRAKMASSPETSEFTSIKQRIEEAVDNDVSEIATQGVAGTSSIALKAFTNVVLSFIFNLFSSIKPILSIIDWSYSSRIWIPMISAFCFLNKFSFYIYY